MIIYRVTRDMFELAEVVDLMTNLCNLKGMVGNGLSLEFRKRCPEFVEEYKELCRTKDLRIGTVKIISSPNTNWDQLLFPTRDHYADTSCKEDILRSLEALRDLLQEDKYTHASVVLPMLGCGLGKQDYPTVLPMIQDTLSDIEATVFISMSPDRTEFRPRYLVIVGPPEYGLSEEDKIKIEQVIDSCMLKWGTTLSDYEGIVSGGYSGVDSFVAGTTYRKNVEDTFVYKRTGKVPLVVHPNKARNGLGSNILHNNLLSEIGDDIILFKPHGHNNNRMTQMQMWLEADKMKREKDGHPPRRIAVYGDNSTNFTNDQILIQVQKDG